jgi:maltose-binding protein MalE
MTPKLGTGKLANFHTATQSISAFITSWSKNKQAAATFLSWLHQPKNLASWYEATGAFPADKRFSAANIKNPLMKKLFALNSQPGQLWAENYAPPQVDSNGLRPFGAAVVTGTSTPAKAAADIQNSIKQWQTQQPADFKSYKLWASGK